MFLLDHPWYLVALVVGGAVAAFFLSAARWAWYVGSAARERYLGIRGFRQADVVAEARRILSTPLRDDGPMA